MILVDASVWIDHLRRRAHMLTALAELPAAPVASHAEALGFLERHGLAGRGIGWPDVHLLASVALAGTARLWTSDKRLGAVAADLGMAYAELR